MKEGTGLLPRLLRVAAVLAILLCFSFWLKDLDSRQREAGRQQLENALRRSVVACYAAEGIYPPNLEYLQEHYGLQIDKTRYRVYYEVFANNLMPEITVLERVP